MVFVAPVALLALIPWGLVSAYLLAGRLRPTEVPFLELWRRGDVPNVPRTRAPRLPPIALLAMILAMLLAVLAAARPRWARGAGSGGEVTVLVDRGLTMSATPGGGTPRYVRLAESIADRVGAGARVELVDLTGGRTFRGDGTTWLDEVRKMRRTAIGTSVPSVRAAIVEATARRPSGPIFVLTDRAVAPVADARVVIVQPREGLKNRSIVTLAARERPTPQVMVEVAGTHAAGVDVRVTSGSNTATRHLEAVAGGRARAFVDLPALSDTVEAQLEGAADDVEADDRAYLTRVAASPRVEARPGLPPALAHMIDVFRKARPAGDGAAVVVVTLRRADVGTGETAAIVEGGSDALAGDLRVQTHPVTAAVDWAGVLRGATAARVQPPEGFAPVVTVGERVAVASRESPARQVWVGFDAPQFARRVDYVVFWTNVLEWLGGGEAVFGATPVTWAPETWEAIAPVPADAELRAWPNVYRRPGGGVEAMTAAATVDGIAGALATSTPAALAPPVGRDVGPHLLVAGCALVALGASTWRRRAAN